MLGRGGGRGALDFQMSSRVRAATGFKQGSGGRGAVSAGAAPRHEAAARVRKAAAAGWAAAVGSAAPRLQAVCQRIDSLLAEDEHHAGQQIPVCVCVWGGGGGLGALCMRCDAAWVR
jgi:hypothetical protein